ncbi:hypothetical protein D9611_005015 [Ephemerocybe angulata]|uniref:F-box domain-containing protein n=1 Tax=Ephemerocybe angulata TaxID=980116 RepID=A0A8H5B397_9AGAR|nr:hypothetical protein D9611_005015 [Tulosesus angulatus]
MDVDPEPTSTSATAAIDNSESKQPKDIASWPTTLLLHLFKRCQAELDKEIEPNPVIIPISQTCRQWRDVALSNASLWTRVYLGFDRFDNGVMHLSRATDAERRLPISVYLSTKNLKLNESQMDRFTLAVAKSKYQWAEVTIEETRPKRLAMLLVAALSNINWNLKLKKLSITCDSSNKAIKQQRMSPLSHLFKVGGAYTTLGHLKIWKFPVTWANIARAPYLNRLDLRRVPEEYFPGWHTFAQMIYSAVYLEHLVLIHVEIPLPIFLEPYPALEVPNLKSLTLYVTHGNKRCDINPTFLKAIKVAPKLETLVVSDLNHLSDVTQLVFSSETKRFPIISSITFLHVNIEEEVPDAFFTATESLKVFRVGGQPGGSYRNIFDKIQDALWPNLEKVVVVKMEELNESDRESLSAFIEKRKESGKEVTVVEVDGEAGIEDWDLGNGFSLEEPQDLYKGRITKRTLEIMDVLSTDSEFEF